MRAKKDFNVITTILLLIAAILAIYLFYMMLPILIIGLPIIFCCIIMVIAVSYTHLDVYKRQVRLTRGQGFDVQRDGLLLINWMDNDND